MTGDNNLFKSAFQRKPFFNNDVGLLKYTFNVYKWFINKLNYELYISLDGVMIMYLPLRKIGPYSDQRPAKHDIKKVKLDKKICLYLDWDEYEPVDGMV